MKKCDVCGNYIEEVESVCSCCLSPSAVTKQKPNIASVNLEKGYPQVHDALKTLDSEIIKSIRSCVYVLRVIHGYGSTGPGGEIRKQVVKTVLRDEKANDKEALKSSYNILNKIFAYIISELNWTISQNSATWDDTPLKIISEVFPKLESTQWFKDQQLSITGS